MRSIKEEILALLPCNGFPLGLLWIGQNGGLSLSILGRDRSRFSHDPSRFVAAPIGTPQLISVGSISSTCPIDLSPDLPAVAPPAQPMTCEECGFTGPVVWRR